MDYLGVVTGQGRKLHLGGGLGFKDGAGCDRAYRGLFWSDRGNGGLA